MVGFGILHDGGKKGYLNVRHIEVHSILLCLLVRNVIKIRYCF